MPVRPTSNPAVQPTEYQSSLTATTAHGTVSTNLLSGHTDTAATRKHRCGDLLIDTVSTSCEEGRMFARTNDKEGCISVSTGEGRPHDYSVGTLDDCGIIRYGGIATKWTEVTTEMGFGPLVEYDVAAITATKSTSQSAKLVVDTNHEADNAGGGNFRPAQPKYGVTTAMSCTQPPIVAVSTEQ